MLTTESLKAELLTRRIRKLASALTYAECMHLQSSPLKPLPNDATHQFIELYELLTTEDDSFKESILADAISNQKSRCLERLPNESLLQISGYLSPKDISSLILTNTAFHDLIGNFRYSSIHMSLLKYVISGEQDAAKRTLDGCPPRILPLLLTEPGFVTDYSGRTILGTALGLALGAQDVRCNKNESCMTEMLLSFFKNIPDSSNEIKLQIRKQFSEDSDIRDANRSKLDMVALERVIAAIADTPAMVEPTLALNEFREYFQPKELITSGTHFNIKLLITALELYDANFARFDGEKSFKNNLFWRKVIGYIQRQLPACYAQAYCQGIHNITDFSKQLKRSMNLSGQTNAKFFPLDLDTTFRLGHEYALAASTYSLSDSCSPKGTPESIAKHKTGLGSLRTLHRNKLFYINELRQMHDQPEVETAKEVDRKYTPK